MGYPVGGFTINESGAFALQLFHTPHAGPEMLRIDPFYYQYSIILDMMYQHIGYFRLACLATFLMCDLAMLISSPAIGFLSIYRTMGLVINEKITYEKLLKWYEYTYYNFN